MNSTLIELGQANAYCNPNYDLEFLNRDGTLIFKLEKDNVVNFFHLLDSQVIPQLSNLTTDEYDVHFVGSHHLKSVLDLTVLQMNNDIFIKIIVNDKNSIFLSKCELMSLFSFLSFHFKSCI